jgi:CheY-like chemotaxis protein
VELAGNGAKALELLRGGQFDLVLMDCQMPVMDGFEATRRIRQGEAGDARIPIIAFTAHASGEEASNCLRSGMDLFVSKPVDLESLRAALERCAVLRGPGAPAKD